MKVENALKMFDGFYHKNILNVHPKTIYDISSSPISAWQSIYDTYNLEHQYVFDVQLLDTLNQQYQQIQFNLQHFDLPYIEHLNSLANKVNATFNLMQPYLNEYADNCIDQELDSNIPDIDKPESKNLKQLFNDKINIIGFLFTIIFGLLSLLPNPEFQMIQQEQKKIITVIEELTETIEALSNEIEQLKQESLVDTANLEEKYSDN